MTAPVLAKPPTGGPVISPEDQELRDLLQVVSPEDVVKWINMLVYGDAGAGKTHLLGTAMDHPDLYPMCIFDVEGGLTTIRKRKGIDVIPVRSMDELTKKFNQIHGTISNGKLYYKSFGLDSLTELADLDMRTIMKKAYAANPDKVNIDVPSPREWGMTRNHIRTIVRAFKDLPANVFFTANVGSLQEDGQPTKYFPGFSGKLRTELPGFVDIVGYLYPEVSDGEIIRKLQVEGTRRIVAKDRTGALGSVVIEPTLPMIWDLIQSS